MIDISPGSGPSHFAGTCEPNRYRKSSALREAQPEWLLLMQRRHLCRIALVKTVGLSAGSAETCIQRAELPSAKQIIAKSKSAVRASLLQRDNAPVGMAYACGIGLPDLCAGNLRFNHLGVCVRLPRRLRCLCPLYLSKSEFHGETFPYSRFSQLPVRR